MPNRGDRVVISNRKARYDYFVLESYECGIVLKGPEVKSIRNGRANLQDGYARIDDGEVWLFGMHVSPYEFSGATSIRSARASCCSTTSRSSSSRARPRSGASRSCRSASTSRTAGPRSSSRSRGKARYDKRQAIAERDAKRETQRAMKGDRE